MSDTADYRYSALPDRPSGTWPDGSRLALVVCVGVESYRFGAGRAEDVLADVPAPDLVNTAWRDYGNRVGAFRLFDLLGRLGIPPTVLLNTNVYDEAPAVLAAARDVGAEIVGHGSSNSDLLSEMTPEVERGYLTHVADRIHEAEGVRPGGWSSPWLSQSPATLNLLAATGYRYLLDLHLDDQPIWMKTESGPLLAIPYAAELNDSSTMIGRSTSARDFADMIDDEFAELNAVTTRSPLVMSVVLHSFISGVPFRLRAIGRVLERIAATDGVWLTTPGEIHRAVVDSPLLFPPRDVDAEVSS